MRQPKKKLSSVKNNKRLPENTDEELKRKKGEENTVVGRSSKKKVKAVLIRFVGMEMCISTAIPRWCLRATSKLDYFGEDLCQNFDRTFRAKFFERY